MYIASYALGAYFSRSKTLLSASCSIHQVFDELENDRSTAFVCTEAWLGQVLKIEAMQGSAEPFLTQVRIVHRKAGFEPTHYSSRILEDSLKVVVITVRTYQTYIPVPEVAHVICIATYVITLFYGWCNDVCMNFLFIKSLNYSHCVT